MCSVAQPAAGQEREVEGRVPAEGVRAGGRAGEEEGQAAGGAGGATVQYVVLYPSFKVGDMQAANRGLESDLEVSRIDIQKLKERLREAQSEGSSRPGGAVTASQGSSSLGGSQEELVVMERSDSEGEEGGSHTLPSFTTATGGSRGGRVGEGVTANRGGRAGEGSTATPPLASCNILARRPLGQIKVGLAFPCRSCVFLLVSVCPSRSVYVCPT